MTRRALNFRGYVKLSFASSHYDFRPNSCHTCQQSLISSEALRYSKIAQQTRDASFPCVAERSLECMSSVILVPRKHVSSFHVAFTWSSTKHLDGFVGEHELCRVVVRMQDGCIDQLMCGHACR